MSDTAVNEIYSDEDLVEVEYPSEGSENINGVSTDAASTFEYVEKNLSPEIQWKSGENLLDSSSNDHDLRDVVNQRPSTCSSSKEEKQRHNEEIVVMESVSASSDTGSWESVPMLEKHLKESKDIKENCKLFLRSERCYNYEIAPSVPAKPRSFIDASSLLDEEDLIYTPPPSTCHKSYNAVNLVQLQESFEAEDKGDCVTGANVLPLPLKSFDDEVKVLCYDIKDQFSAIDKPFIRENKSHSGYSKFDDGGSSRENEKHKGNLIFQNAIPQFSGHQVRQQHDENYASDLSIQSVYSSNSGEPKEFNDFTNTSSHYNSLCENTSDYNSGYSRIQSDSDSIVLPETPFNSIVQVAKQLKIFEANDSDDNVDWNLEQSDIKRQASCPIRTPKRTMKYDELAPILSGGASVKDFTPKLCESPLTRRKTDSCPIVSGGSIDLAVVEDKPRKRDPQKSSLSHSWVVDFNELHIHESDERQPKSLDYTSTNNPLGFYVGFNSLKSQDSKSTRSIDDTNIHNSIEKARLKKSTGFYVDFSDNSCPETPKHVDPDAEIKPKANTSDKKNIFSMFIDFNEDKNSKSETHNKKTVGKQEMSTNNSSKLGEAMSMETNDDDKDKKGCYMFIDSDSPVVRRRTVINSKSDIKRHSWNVNPQEGQSDAVSVIKKYQRSTSVSNDKGIMNILEKFPLLSKTSSMSIDSSVSPYEDFSCSKSFSSYSNNSVTTSNSSIDQSGTKILLDENMMNSKKRRKDVKLNETFDKSSQGSITEGILLNDDSQAESTDTDDVTFQNNEQEELNSIELRKDISTGDFKTKMETIPEISESSPNKKNLDMKDDKNEERKEDQSRIEKYTMESLQALIEKQKQILESEESAAVSFVKLSDLDKPPPPAHHTHFENSSMSNSAGARVSRPFNEAGHRSLTLQYETRHNNSWNMSRSTGNNFANLASSAENSKSLSRLFPHLSKVISSSVPSNVGLNTDTIFYDNLEFISSDFSCTSSVTSSRSGMDSADESSISCRQPRRLGEDLLKMFLQEIATDVTLEVGNRKMRAHKCILRSRCQYFAAILAGNWVTHAGNVIQLAGYSYSAVHFALCHIYSGASHPPEGISLMELASLSDLLGLEGLKEVTAYALKTNYCHNFHKPCSGCIDGILQVLPVTLNNGLDELYRKCLKWVCKHYSKVWLTRPFSQLPSDVHQRCRQQISAHLTSENVLNWILECEDMLKSLEQCRWNIINVDNLVRDILDSAHAYVVDHFASLLASDSFLSLGHGENYTISRLESLFLRAAAVLTPEQACRSYPRAVRLNQLLTAKIILPNPLSNDSLQILQRANTISLRQEDQDGWNEDFIKLVSSLLSAIEQCLTRQCSKAMRCSAWQRMDIDLKSKIQKLACLSDNDELRRLRSSTSSISSVRNFSASSSVSSRTNDLRQVKLAIQAHTRKFQGLPIENSSIPVIKKTTSRPQSMSSGHQITKCSTRVNVPEKLKPTHRRSQSEDTATLQSISKEKLTSVKSRYMEPKNPKLTAGHRPNACLQLKVKNLSSSESSTRGSSPASNRRLNIGVRKSSNLSLDSLQSPSKQRLQISAKMKNENMELSIDSLVDSSIRSSMKTEKTVSSESLVKRGRNLTDESKLLKNDGKSKAFDKKRTQLSIKQNSLQNNQVQRSFLSQKSREILAKKNNIERKHSTNSTSSVATAKSTIPSPKINEINKSNSSVSLDSKKKVYSTTLHLRKTARLPEPIVENKLTTSNKVAKSGLLIAKNVKTISLKKNVVKEKRNESKEVLRAPIAKQEESEVLLKMTRSNTFSKETSDNPLELLKTIN